MDNLNFNEVTIADLHIHSRFSRACSKDLTIPNLEKWARVKGIDLLGTGDFTHNIWLNELKENLKDNGNGIFISSLGFKFVLTGEISLMYSTECAPNAKGKTTRGRKVHLVLLAPSFEAVNKINAWLDTKGRRDYDGRPIFKISCEDFVAKMKILDDKIEAIPAHIWTPYFGVFGSASGFDSLKEAFGSQFENIHAIETGISSTPEMNLKVKELHGKTIVSCSDSHSFWPWRLGREATIFKRLDSYEELIRQLRENDIVGTVEVNPAYGMYHFDGHRDCAFSCSPDETKRINKICPFCKKEITLGVDYRVHELADTLENKSNKKVFEILPLMEIISLAKKTAMSSKKAWEIYTLLTEKLGTEFNILINVSKSELEKVTPTENLLVDLIIKNRNGEIRVKPGYDGIYGVAVLENNKMQDVKQKKLI